MHRDRLLPLLILFIAALKPLHGQTSPDRAALIARLDSIASSAQASQHLAGVSVAVVRGKDTLLNRGYGFADLSLQVPATDATTYRVIGPTLAAAVMQQVELGRVKLNDDVAKLLPDFPWQGKRVTLRQLMDATSGLPDFHYLGDAHLTTIATTRAPDEIAALIAGRPFQHEPGAKWQWTISGFHLSGGLVEQLSGQSFRDYVREHVIARARLQHTYYCDDAAITPGLARTYRWGNGGMFNGRIESATTYPYIATTCATAADAVSLMRALHDGRLLKAESWRVMTTAEGAAQNAGTHSARGVGLRIDDEEGHRWVGEIGAVLSSASVIMDFADDSLTIAVLTNTASQAGLPLARNLARSVLGLPPVPPVAASAQAYRPVLVEGTPITVADRRRYLGTYHTKPINPAGPLASYERTYRVFEQAGRLMVQALGENPVPLFHQEGDSFSSAIARFAFTMEGGRATAVEVRVGESVSRGTLVTNRR